MLAPSTLEIERALESKKLRSGLQQYRWLQAKVRQCNLTTDREFQRHFCAFYRVRRSFEWQREFFALMEKSKGGDVAFSEALRTIHRSTGRIEASFTSKLVATLDASKPVLDKFVLGHFRLRLPAWSLADREDATIEVYDRLRLEYDRLTASPEGLKIRDMFDEMYPDAQITDIKKIDLVLWQIRPK